jgi:hypothetical protein
VAWATLCRMGVDVDVIGTEIFAAGQRALFARRRRTSQGTRDDLRAQEKAPRSAPSRPDPRDRDRPAHRGSIDV